MRIERPGWYGSHRPDGSWAVLVRGSHIDTHLGRVELPHDGVSNVLFLDQAMFNGEQMLAGQSDAGPAGCWLKKGSQPWQIVGGAHGEQMVRFSDDGRYLFVADSGDTGYWIDLATDQKAPFATAFGVDGIRSVHGPDRVMQLGNTTRFSPSLNVSQFTTLDGGMVVGQGRVVGGCVVIRGADRRIVEPGNCDFYKAHQTGSTLAVAITKQAEGVCVMLKVDLAELDSYPVETTEQPIPPVPVIGKPLWLAWFEFADPVTLPPGNALLKIHAGAKVASHDGRYVGQWVQGDSVETIEQQAAQAASPIAYWDARTWPRWPALPQGSWLALQAYCRADESPVAFEGEMRRLIASAPAGQQLALVCQCYTSNTALTTNLPALVPVYAALARDYPQLTMLLPFSDQGRGTGLNDHPEALAPWTALAAGIVGEPGEAPVSQVDFNIANQRAVDYWKELQVSEKSKAIRDRYQRGGQIVGTSPHTGQPWTADQAGDDQAYPEIQHLQSDAFKEIMGRLYWNDDIPLEMFYKNGTGAPPAEDIVIHRLSPTSVEYRDGVQALGHETAAIGLLPPYGPPSDQAHVALCAPPPKPSGGGVTDPDPPDPQPGAFVVEVLSFDALVHRSDPNGMLVRFAVLSGRPVVKIDLDLVGDDEPSIPITFSAEVGRDGRYVRGLCWKPVRNGTYPLLITATDDQGNVGKSDGSHQVTVVP